MEMMCIVITSDLRLYISSEVAYYNQRENRVALMQHHRKDIALQRYPPAHHTVPGLGCLLGTYRIQI